MGKVFLVPLAWVGVWTLLYYEMGSPSRFGWVVPANFWVNSGWSYNQFAAFWLVLGLLAFSIIGFASWMVSK